MSEDDFRRFRLQHGVYSSRFQPNYSLIRIKIPGGVVSPDQLERIGEVAAKFSIGSAHVTTRQDFQLHWLVLEDVPEILSSLGEVGLTSREACGNTVRNIISSPLAGTCPYEAFDVSPYVSALARFLLRNIMNQCLPRKFKINFSCCEQHGLARIGDIGVIPRFVDGRRGFEIYFGGGLGPGSFIAETVDDFTDEDDFLATIIAIIRLFDRLGDRQKMHRNRMRYLVHDIGVQKFRELIIKERALTKLTFPSIASAVHNVTDNTIQETSPNIEATRAKNLDAGSPQCNRWLKTNTFQQKQSGYYAVFITLPAGDISSDQLLVLSKIAKEYSREGNVRTSLTQSIVLRSIVQEDLSEVYATLASAGLANPGGLTIAATIGCSGTTSCNLALTNSHRLAKEIQRKLIDLKMDMDPEIDGTIKISGCPNSCGQHEVATLGFSGGGVRINGVQTPAYTMLIGGEMAGKKAKLGIPIVKVPARKVIDAVLKIIETYKEERSPGETLTSWIGKIIKGEGNPRVKTVEDLKKNLEEVLTIPTYELSPESYIDWGATQKYRAKTAKGECAP